MVILIQFFFLLVYSAATNIQRTGGQLQGRTIVRVMMHFDSVAFP